MWKQKIGISLGNHYKQPPTYEIVNIVGMAGFVPSQQKWTQKSFKKRNESQYFVNLRKPTAFIPRFA